MAWFLQALLRAAVREVPLGEMRSHRAAGSAAERAICTPESVSGAVTMPETPSDYTAQNSGAGPEPVHVSFLTVGTVGRAAGQTDGQRDRNCPARLRHVRAESHLAAVAQTPSVDFSRSCIPSSSSVPGSGKK